jgi:hypothetical protein
MGLLEKSGGVLGRRWGPTRLGWLVAVFMAALAGCSGEKGRVPVFPVSGKVTVQGEPPQGALLVFHPEQRGGEEALRPTAKVKEDGSFQLTTYDGDDGAPAGDYIVTVQWNKLVKKGSDYSAGPNVVPPAYAKPETSPWKVNVAESGKVLESMDIKK